jgi:ABC1 atypical kinase-like domain
VFDFQELDTGAPRNGVTRGRAQRTASLLALTARTAAEGLRLKIEGGDHASFHTRAAESYAELFGQSRGALMKAGQMLSLALALPAVPAEFQPVYRSAFARLRNAAPAMEPALARAVLEQELGPVEDLFAEFDWRPLACASVGQVHAARTRDGRPVAVKIQYPGVANAIAADLKNVELLAAFISLYFSCVFSGRMSFDFRGAAREIGARIAEELDYRLEAANQAEFARLYRGHPFIHVPDVAWELCTARVLTQELVRGRSWEEAVTAGQELRDQWAEVIWRFAYGTNVRFCMLHADPHPGNYLFHDDGSVSFLDYGCVKRFPAERSRFMVIGVPCCEGDVLGTWRACVEFGVFRASDPVTPEDAFAYVHPWLEMYWAEQPLTITPEDADRWTEARISPEGPAANAYRHITLSPEYAMVGRIELGVTAVIAGLHPCGPWRSMGEEYNLGAEPLTSIGKQDQAFFEEAGAARQA